MYITPSRRFIDLIHSFVIKKCGIDLNKVTNHFMETAALMIASGKLSVERLYEIVNNSLEIDKQN